MKIINTTPFTFAPLVGLVNFPKYSLTLIVRGTFDLKHGSVARYAEEQELPTGDQFYEDDEFGNGSSRYESDFAYFKRRADLLLVGNCHTPGKDPRQQCRVTFQVGGISKSLVVFGNRYWKPNFLQSTATEPLPFTELPMRYENSFGGLGYTKNPIGKGYVPVQTQSGEMLKPLPNIEDPLCPVESTRSHPDPAGFGPLGKIWPQRYKNLGTYDNNWLKQRWPWFPEDFDWGHFNAAQPYMQVEGYLQGDEEIFLENLHPEHPSYRSQLPGLRARCFLNEVAETDAIQHRFREVPLFLDTLFIDMEREKLNLVWRGVANVRTLKLKEIEHILIAAEQVSEREGSLGEYQVLFNRHLAGEQVGKVFTTDGANADFEKRFAEMERNIKRMEASFAEPEKDVAKLKAEATKVMADHKAELIAAGIDSSLLEQPTATQTSSENLAAIALAINELKNNPAVGKDIDVVQMGRVLKEVEQTQKETEQFDRDIEELKKEFEKGKVQLWTRQLVQSAVIDGKSLSEQNLSELDLSALDLSGVDFHGAIFIKTNLKQANLAEADLKETNLNGADLSGANLTNSLLDNADLSAAILTNAKLIGLSLNATTLAGLNLADADFSKSIGKHTDFSKSDLTNANFSDAQLPQADFSYCKLDGALFNGAQLQAAQFCGVSASGISMENADITGLHGNEGANFTEGSFKSVQGQGAIFEESLLDRADFSRSILVGAQFSEASLCDAVFDRVQAVSAVFDDAIMQRVSFTNSDVLRATFDRVDLSDANLHGSNFFEAGFWETHIIGARFYAANLNSTLLG